MNRNLPTLRIATAAFIVSAGLLVASCGGGSIGSLGGGTTPTSASQQSIPTSAATLTLPAASDGQFSTVNFLAGAPAGVLLTASSSTTAPGSAPAPSSFKRAVQSVNGAVPFFFVTFSVSASISTGYFSSESVTLNSADPTTAAYYVEFDDITASAGSKLGTSGPGTVSNGVATISNSTAAPYPVLVPGHTYLMQFYFVPAGTPTSSPTSAPTGGGSSSPTSEPSGGTTSGYTFSGGSASTGTCSPTNCAVPVSFTDGGITFAALFNSPSTTTDVTINGATSTAQISPSGFQTYTGTGTVEMYVEVTATVTATFPQTPSISISGISNSETACSFYGQQGNGSWALLAPQTGAAPASGGTSTIPATTEASGMAISPTPFYGAVVCTP